LPISPSVVTALKFGAVSPKHKAIFFLCFLYYQLFSWSLFVLSNGCGGLVLQFLS
jgi:hypothetical protein